MTKKGKKVEQDKLKKESIERIKRQRRCRYLFPNTQTEGFTNGTAGGCS